MTNVKSWMCNSGVLLRLELITIVARNDSNVIVAAIIDLRRRITKSLGIRPPHQIGS